MSPARALCLAPLAILAVLAAHGCGRDPAQVRWDADFERALHTARADPAAAERSFIDLAETAPRAVDEGAARRELVRLVAAQGRTLEAARLLLAIAERARRQDDRARAYYELGRLAETRGRLDAARLVYRALVRTYPELMPGERALAHLLRLARADSFAAVDQHLAWTLSLRETLAHTALADDLLFQAADEARRRALLAERAGRPADWDTAELLFRRLADGPRTPLWNDAIWELSWIHHRRGRHDAEITEIRRILRTREELSLFGQDEHPYYWMGQLRIARLLLVELDRPHDAIDAYLTYAELFPKTIKKDDVRFYALCAALRSPRPDDRARVAELADLLRSEHPDSRFTRRLDDARADPRGPHCLPPEVTP